MKKQLLSTSAIALGVAMAAPATAQEWDMNWGGFANTHIGAVDVSGTGIAPGADFDGVDVYTNSEVIFSPSVTLDNGLTMGFSVQFEALNSGTSEIDESYVTIEGDMLGKIILGSENSAGYLLMGSVYTPGIASMAINSYSISGFIPTTGTSGFRQAGISSLTEVAGNNDVQRISYFTPSFNGLTLGVSYAASGDVNAANNFAPNRNAVTITDIFDIGVGYQQSFNGVDLGLAARWGTANTNLVGVSDPETWGIGATVGVNNFTFGATYTENDNGGPNGVGGVVTGSGGGAGADSEGYSLGVNYDIAGPWSVGAETYQGEVQTGVGNPTSDYEAYKVGATRDLGAGVSWDVYYLYTEQNNGTVAGNPKIEGNMLATAINLSF
ncbi:porin [Roseovarius tibetensis]|uniref:porin n=1 Tax=Roseovarius tibetensis TaxID=2685897 RepID=UPI003D7FD236